VSMLLVSAETKKASYGSQASEESDDVAAV
jgi:hypothetical protein